MKKITMGIICFFIAFGASAQKNTHSLTSQELMSGVAGLIGKDILDQERLFCVYVPEMNTQNVQAGNNFKLVESEMQKETVLCADKNGALAIPTESYYVKVDNHFIKETSTPTHSMFEVYSLDLKNKKLYYTKTIVFKNHSESEKYNFLAGTVSSQGDIKDYFTKINQ